MADNEEREDIFYELPEESRVERADPGQDLENWFSSLREKFGIEEEEVVGPGPEEEVLEARVPTIEEEDEELGLTEEEKERRRKAAAFVGRAEGLQEEAALARGRRDVEYEKYLRRKYKKGYRTDVLGKAAKTAKTMEKIVTLGGKPKFVRRELYGSPGMAKLTAPPTAMRKLHVMGGERVSKEETPLRRATTPRLERLRKATDPGSGSMSPIARAAMPSTRLARTAKIREEALAPLRGSKPQINVFRGPLSRKKKNTKYYRNNVRKIKRSLR